MLDFMVQSSLDSKTQGLDMPINAVSHSRLVKYENCPLSAKLAYVDKIPEPERPLPPGKTEHANDRGTRIHEAAERFIKGGVELIPELKNFEPEFLKARELFSQGKASTEGEWAFTKDWEPVAWMSSNVYVRLKCDLVVHRDVSDIIVVDFKSGKRYGNEIKHGEQVHLYCATTFIRYPKAQTVTTELWYTDINELVTKTYTRAQGLRFLPGFETRFETMVTDEEFKPRPSSFTCKWCPYGPKGTGHCKVGKQ
jgi:hypothetical protein